MSQPGPFRLALARASGLRSALTENPPTESPETEPLVWFSIVWSGLVLCERVGKGLAKGIERVSEGFPHPFSLSIELSSFNNTNFSEESGSELASFFIILAWFGFIGPLKVKKLCKRTKSSSLSNPIKRVSDTLSIPFKTSSGMRPKSNAT